MIDIFTIQLSFLIFEAISCFLSTLVYAVSKDPFSKRKSVALSLNASCGLMLICEFLFYVYKGSTDPFDVLIMKIVNAAVYYLIALLVLFYAMLVSIRLFKRFDLKKDMPCRRRIITICATVTIGLILVTVSQFNGIYYYFDKDNVYQRGPLFLLATIIPTFGVILVATMIVQFRDRISRSQQLVLISYLILPMIGEAIQVLFYGNSFLNICIGLSVLLMFYENYIYKEKEIIKASKIEIRTGLANEHGYTEWMRKMKGRPELTDYAAVFFDLRKFSDINRIYGVENGNRVLANFGTLISSGIGKDEIIGRQFGNQFVAIVRKQNLESLLGIIKKADVSFTDKGTGEEKTVTLTSHIGVYMIDRTDLDGEDILVFAGQALSEAKLKDTEDVVWLTKELIDSISDRKKLESDILDGLRNGEFRPYYQPKVNLTTGKLCGAEALSRWIRNGTVNTPGYFIPLMESNDTVRQLDMHILKTVCSDIANWLSQGIDVPTVSVNFSRRNLVDPDLAENIDSVVKSVGIPKGLIEIEITESSDEFSISTLRRFVDSLHKLGYKASIDDFGSANSSLKLLREIPFDTLKIDKGFIDNAKQKDIAILTHIINMAGDIDIDIVAEGVEQKEQIDTLGGLGVRVIQGFYYDSPLSEDEMTGRLRTPDYH